MNNTSHRAGAELWIIAAVGEQVAGISIDGDGDLLRLERTINVGKNEVKDLGQLSFAKRRKDTNFVKAVDEFRLKFTAVNKRIDEFSLKLSKVVARIDRFANMVSAGVTSGNDNCIAEANFAVLNIAQDSLVEKLQECCKDFRMSFFNLVKQND